MLDAWPATGVVNIPMRPVTAVTAVRVRAADGTPSVVPPGSYVFEGAGLPPRLVPASGALPNPGRAAGGIEIDFTAGYGAAATSVPEPIRQALKLLVAHWYEHRDPVEIGDPETAIPAAVSALVKPYGVSGYEQTIAAMRQRVALEEATVAADGGGGAIVAWELVAEVWAAIIRNREASACDVGGTRGV